MTRIVERPLTICCAICLDSWTVESVAVEVSIRLRPAVICGKCAEAIGETAAEERKRRTSRPLAGVDNKTAV